MIIYKKNKFLANKNNKKYGLRIIKIFFDSKTKEKRL